MPSCTPCRSRSVRSCHELGRLTSSTASRGKAQPGITGLGYGEPVHPILLGQAVRQATTRKGFPSWQATRSTGCRISVKVEDPGRQDEDEGAYGIQPDQTAHFRIWISDSPSEAVDLVPDLISAKCHLDAVDNLNVACMHVGYLDKTELRNAGRGTGIPMPPLPKASRAWGSHAVLVTDVRGFLDRVRVAARRQNPQASR